MGRGQVQGGPGGCLVWVGEQGQGKRVNPYCEEKRRKGGIVGNREKKPADASRKSLENESDEERGRDGGWE